MKAFCILLFLLNAVCAATITELGADMALEIARNTNPFNFPKLMLTNKFFYDALKPYNEIFNDIWKECKISSYDDDKILWIDPSAYFKPESSCKKSINVLIYLIKNKGANAIAASKSDEFTKDFLPKIGINNFNFGDSWDLLPSELSAQAELLTKGQISHLVISNNVGGFITFWGLKYSVTALRSFFTGLRQSGITHLDLSYTNFSYEIISIILQNLPTNLKEFVCLCCSFDRSKTDSSVKGIDLVKDTLEAQNIRLVLGNIVD